MTLGDMKDDLLKHQYFLHYKDEKDKIYMCTKELEAIYGAVCSIYLHKRMVVASQLF